MVQLIKLTGKQIPFNQAYRHPASGYDKSFLTIRRSDLYLPVVLPVPDNLYFTLTLDVARAELD